MIQGAVNDYCHSQPPEPLRGVGNANDFVVSIPHVDSSPFPSREGGQGVRFFYLCFRSPAAKMTSASRQVRPISENIRLRATWS